MNRLRRRVLGGFLGGSAISLFLGQTWGEKEKNMKLGPFRNEDYYREDGSFDVEKAKKSYYEMMEFHGYPIPDRLRTEEFWTLDFGLGKFTEVGMAGIFWVNNQRDNYFGHEIYLLPGQMIPEHKHVATPNASPKMEAWQPRHGWVTIYGEGKATEGVMDRVPSTHKGCVQACKEQKLLPGEVGILAGAEQWHWMLAGPEGAIVTEYATYHDGDGLRFSHPDVSMV